MKKNTKATVAKVQQLVWNFMNGIGVCCYGTDSANLLMWFHYADSHQGICLKFDLLAKPADYIDMIQVSYSREYPSIATLDFESMTKFLSVKSDDWAYEREWRVYTRTGPGSKSFSKQGLVEVTLGAQAAAGPADALAELLDADPEYNHVLLRQARLSDRTFSLEFDKY